MNERCNKLETQVKDLTNLQREANNSCIRSNSRVIDFGLRMNETNRAMKRKNDLLDE